MIPSSEDSCYSIRTTNPILVQFASTEEAFFLHNSVESKSMEHIRELGRMMVFAGVALAAVGALLWFAGRHGGLPLRLGRLPGDIAVQGKHGSFYFPVVTCILLSVALTLILWLVQWLKR